MGVVRRALPHLGDRARSRGRFTPHDFRRIFATDLVNNGLLIHIGAALLGHYVGDFVNPVAAERGWGVRGEGVEQPVNLWIQG